MGNSSSGQGLAFSHQPIRDIERMIPDHDPEI
jgi:hypothetical protein